MNALAQHLRVWAASARYSLTRALMFRGDFIIWSLVELFWMGVNLLLVEVIYRHTDSIAGWNRAEMLLLLGTLFCTVAGYFALQPLMEGTRTGQGPLSFGQLHGISVGFFLVKLLCILGLAWRVADPGGRPALNPPASS